MYFMPSEYKKQIKLGTRCFVADAVDTLYKLSARLTSYERKWFEEHPQFRHFFHSVPKANEKGKKKPLENHKVQGMWMLLMRNAEIEKQREVWFIVNGIPIRYGLREHALISGLNCKNYPMGYNEYGNLDLVKKHFKKGPIRLEDVKEKLMTMQPHKERLNIAVLFFLASVVCAQTKSGPGAPPVLEFFQRAVGDLDFCRDFPWGRYSFDYLLKEISHTMDHFGGQVKEKCIWPMPGFCVALEHLAFEAIQPLGSTFRVPVEGADEHCPRMCRWKFKATYLKGYLLSEIYQALGDTKDIDSIIPLRSEEEKQLLDELMEEDVEDKADPVVESWLRRLDRGFTVFFPDMYEQDLAGREEAAVAADEVTAAIEGCSTSTLEDVIKKSLRKFGKQLKTLEKKVDKMDKKYDERIGALEDFVNSMRKGKGKEKN